MRSIFHKQFELVPDGVTGVSDDNALTRIGIVSEVPEPAAFALLALGLALMARTARRRRMQ
jgi:hypothetical protein